MERAEHQIDANVDDRETEWSLLAKIDDPGLDRGDELLRYYPADDRVLELKTGAARLRRDVDIGVAELAMSAGLFLVTSLDPLDPATDGLLIGNPRRLGQQR